jgi:predicted secreted Zn-dependent protease
MMLLIFPYLLISLVQVKEPATLIDWTSDKKLTWSDFKGTPDAGSTNAALTSSSITIEFGYSNRGMNYGIKCRFNTASSWGRIKNEHILAHEQGHFDLAELHARKLNKALKEYVFNSKTVSKDVNAIYDAIMKEHHQVQQEYDEATDHSRKVTAQKEWEEKIAAELKSLEKFQHYKK